MGVDGVEFDQVARPVDVGTPGVGRRVADRHRVLAVLDGDGYGHALDAQEVPQQGAESRGRSSQLTAHHGAEGLDLGVGSAGVDD